MGEAPEMAGAETTQRDAGGIDPNFERLGGVLGSKNNTLADWTPLGDAASCVLLRQVEHVITRCRVSPTMARALAPRVYGEARDG
jgi:hypothetical protein